MTRYNKIIKGIAQCGQHTFSSCDDCPYYNDNRCVDEILKDVVETLKAMRNCMNCAHKNVCVHDGKLCKDWMFDETE